MEEWNTSPGCVVDRWPGALNERESFIIAPELHLRQCIDCCRLRVTDRASVFRCYSEVIQDTTLSLVLGPQPSLKFS